MLKTLIGRPYHVERCRGTPQQLTILNRGPTLLLDCANLKLGKIPPQLPRYVLVKENAPHTI
jgi:hypothetical protein